MLYYLNVWLVAVKCKYCLFFIGCLSTNHCIQSKRISLPDKLHILNLNVKKWIYKYRHSWLLTVPFIDLLLEFVQQYLKCVWCILKTIPIRFYVDTILQEFFYNGKNLILDFKFVQTINKWEKARFGDQSLT